MRLIRFGDKGNKKPGVWLADGRRTGASGQRLGGLKQQVIAFRTHNSNGL